MDLFFAQHGNAASREEDPDRPLTDQGRSETRRVARFLAASGVVIDEIWHSGKLRARQTAELFAEALEPAAGVRGRDGLGPEDDPAEVVEAVRASGQRILLVGHKPFMDRLPSLLLADGTNGTPVDVRHSGIGALREKNGAGWTLRWYLPPDLA